MVKISTVGIFVALEWALIGAFTGLNAYVLALYIDDAIYLNKTGYDDYYPWTFIQTPLWAVTTFSSFIRFISTPIYLLIFRAKHASDEIRDENGNLLSIDSYPTDFQINLTKLFGFWTAWWLMMILAFGLSTWIRIFVVNGSTKNTLGTPITAAHFAIFLMVIITTILTTVLAFVCASRLQNKRDIAQANMFEETVDEKIANQGINSHQPATFQNGQLYQAMGNGQFLHITQQQQQSPPVQQTLPTLSSSIPSNHTSVTPSQVYYKAVRNQDGTTAFMPYTVPSPSS